MNMTNMNMTMAHYLCDIINPGCAINYGLCALTLGKFFMPNTSFSFIINNIYSFFKSGFLFLGYKDKKTMETEDSEAEV